VTRLPGIVPEWPAPAGVGAFSTTRLGGVSAGRFGAADGSPHGLNLGDHVGDDPDAVRINRARLAAQVPGPVLWLRQVHGVAVHDADAQAIGAPSAAGRDAATQDAATRDAAAQYAATRDAATQYAATRDAATQYAATRDAASQDAASLDAATQGRATQYAATLDTAGRAAAPAGPPDPHAAGPRSPSSVPDPLPAPVADAAITACPGTVLAIMTADCLPILLADREGRMVGAAHAGWRGLAAGVAEATVDAMRARLGADASLLAWLGPAIGPRAFEVGEEVRAAFCDLDASAAQAFERADEPGKWRADLYRLARLRLASRGVEAVYGGDRCTVLEPRHFYSHRRDRSSGRMASLVWLAR
jgi:YfiH family protein